MMVDLNGEKLHMSLAYCIFIDVAYLGHSPFQGHTQLSQFIPREQIQKPR